MLPSIVIFCLTWSVGASTDYEGRQKFNTNLRKILASKGLPLLENSYYNYYFNEKTKSFEEWRTRFASFEVNMNHGFH